MSSSEIGPEGQVPPETARRAGSDDRLSELLARFERVRLEQERLLDEMRANERRLRALARRSWRIEEEERRRLARELHDGVGQILTALKNDLARLAAAPHIAGADLAATVAVAAHALQETRELSRSLRPALLDDLGLEPALRALARGLRERAGFAVELSVSGTIADLGPEIETLLYRVAQQALSNACEHSGASGATLELIRRDDRICLRVSDRGRGCDAEAALIASEAQPGIGLHSIRDRVSLVGGRFRFDAQPGRGVSLAVELPLPPEAR